MIPDLAPELTSHILSFCDKRTLQKCSTLSRDFSILAGRVLYANLNLNESILASILPPESQSGWVSRLQFAKEITVDFKHLEPYGLLPFVQILQSLPNLSLFKLVILQTSLDDIHAINDLSLSTSSFSWHICSKIEDSYQRETGALGTGIFALKDLCIMTSWQEGIRKSTVPRLHERPVLHSLRLEHDPNPWSTLEALIDITELQRLSFWLGGAYGLQDHSPPKHILDLSANSLRTLSMFKCTSATSSQNPVNRPFPKLETLILWIANHPLPIRSWLTATVSTIIPQSPNLRRLCVYIHLPPTNKKVLIDVLNENEELMEFFTFLSTQRNLSHIEIWFWCSVSTKKRPSEVELEGSIRQWLNEGSWTGSLKCVWYRNWTRVWPFWERDKHMSPYTAVDNEESD
ncbi:hypothetical protein DL96DRAFT_1609957 [Flagelloscypha sp. PMI_526]|nr:hypothetical protein DL96DRAFT_1609957 [Flagelloscypha sp. PMI_526]